MTIAATMMRRGLEIIVSANRIAQPITAARDAETSAR